MYLADRSELALAALLLEAAIGYPPFVYRAFGHPVTWMGALLGWLERRFNRFGGTRGCRVGGGIGVSARKVWRGGRPLPVMARLDRASARGTASRESARLATEHARRPRAVPRPLSRSSRAMTRTGTGRKSFGTVTLERFALTPFARRRLLGVLALVLLLTAAGGIALALERLLSFGLGGRAAIAVLASSLLAQRSLHGHVRAVAEALETEGLAAARTQVSRIVGRNPDRLDEAGVARAAIESLAENFSDGIVAPAFWLAAGGLGGAAIYKAANTADSMIGHRTPRYAAFGWAAARFDDVANLPASRLSAVFLVLGALAKGASGSGAVRAVWRDASRHRSPNAGWPEAAMAGALGLKLAGPRVYGEDLVDDAFMGDGRRDATAADVRQALAVFRAACAAGWVTLLAIVLISRV